MNNVKKSIGWADFTINPVKGLCPMACKDNEGKEYCYARKMYKRFKRNPEIRLEPHLFNMFHELKRKKPSRVFVGSTMELFGDWIKPEWSHSIFSYCKAYSEHTFIFLTKKPENLIKWSPFPPNCFVGVSVTQNHQLADALKYLRQIEATVKFISFEPLLERINLDL